ncbi:MAG: ABC transporter permease [Nocardioidaceae bacterium]
MSVDTLDAQELEIEEGAVAAAPPRDRAVSVVTRTWGGLWPKLLAVGTVLAVWQSLYSFHWRPEFLFASPSQTFGFLGDEATGHSQFGQNTFWQACATTLQRGVVGFAFALAVGSVVGIAVSQWRVLRSAVGSMITGLQTMPSIAWFPFAMLVFGLDESAIMFVIILGAAPSIANGIISGIDDIQPNLLRAGHMLGARGLDRYRYVVLPAALPSYVAGLKQGWAFAWRSLLAGELLVTIPGHPSLGATLDNARNSGNSAQLMGIMIVVLVIGMVIDLFFTKATATIHSRRGLTGMSTG